MAYMVMAYMVMAYVVMAYLVTAYIVMAYLVTAHIVLAYVVKVYTFMAYGGMASDIGGDDGRMLRTSGAAGACTGVTRCEKVDMGRRLRAGACRISAHGHISYGILVMAC